MHVYCDWLYTNTVYIDENVARDSEDFGLRILKAYSLACRLDDDDFWHAVVANYIAENRFAPRFWLTAINYVFIELEEEDGMDDSDDETSDDHDDGTDGGMDGFVIDNFIEAMDSQFFRRYASTFPELFVQKLSQRLLAKALRPTQKDVLEEHTSGVYEISE